MVDLTAEVNELIAYHGDVTRAMTAERTALESRLIPVSAYILISAVEAWYRWPTWWRPSTGRGRLRRSAPPPADPVRA